jgi:hypothetical protein
MVGALVCVAMGGLGLAAKVFGLVDGPGVDIQITLWLVGANICATIATTARRSAQ